MLKNYFKIAIAVLKRRKFFTFISLFGISFTLTILMVLTALVDNLLSAGYPDLKRDRSRYLNRVVMTSKEGWINSSPYSFYFLDRYAGSLKSAEKVAISSGTQSSNTYIHNRKVVIDIKFTNADFWDVADFDFTEGKPYSKQQINRAERVAVISERTRRDYFGDATAVLGRYIEADNVQYRVTGVVKNAPATSSEFYAGMYLPYTVSKSDYRARGSQGPYTAVLLAASPDAAVKMEQEYAGIISRVKPDDKEFDQLHSFADPYFTALVRGLTGGQTESAVGIVVLGCSLVVLLFLLLPTINLVNVNITRIMERSSEIGVRKAFGASSRTLVYQFIVENVILTLIGGSIGLLLSVGALHFINSLELITDLPLHLNGTVLACSLLTCLFFGLLSGVYPAWRMSRLTIVDALKAN